jgi:hypothetical protein
MALRMETPGNPVSRHPVGANDYQAGQIAALDSLGNAVLCGTEAAAGTVGPKNKPIGVFGEDHLTSTLITTTQINEEIALQSGVAVALSHNAVIASSQRVVVKSSQVLLTVNTDYTINNTNGTITSTGTQANGTVVQVSYDFQLNDAAEKNFRGTNFINNTDDTAGSGKSTVWKGFSEFQTDQFVTSQSYAVEDDLRITHSSHAFGAGVFTNESAGSTVVDTVVGRVLAVPTASNPFLTVEWKGWKGPAIA